MCAGPFSFKAVVLWHDFFGREIAVNHALDACGVVTAGDVDRPDALGAAERRRKESWVLSRCSLGHRCLRLHFVALLKIGRPGPQTFARLLRPRRFDILFGFLNH